MPQSDKQLEIVSDILDKMIDLQSQNVQHLSTLSSSIHEITAHVKETNYRFTNGFRSEIKDHVSQEANNIVHEMQETRKIIEENNKNFRELINTIKSPKVWIQLLIGFIIAVAGATGSIGTCIYTLDKIGGSNTQIRQQQTSPPDTDNDNY